MEENKSRNSAEEGRKTLGLRITDTAYYDLNGAMPEVKTEGAETDPPKKGKSRGFVLPFILGALCCLTVLAVLTEVLGLGKFVTKEKFEYYRELDDNYGKYYEIMKLIEEDPIADSSAGKIGEEQLREMVASTGDPYAQYFTAEEYAEFVKRYSGEYVGVGVGVAQEGDEILVKQVFEDSPAAEAGVEEGDVLVKIDGKAPADVDDAVNMLDGKPGTSSVVTFRRDGAETEKKLTRAKIDPNSVEYSKADGTEDIGYIRISSFLDDTDKEFKAAVKELKNEGCTGFIIDLRNNGGGVVSSSIEIADYLLPACTIMSEKTKNGSETVHTSKAGSAGIKYAVLVNGNTASASEILTAAIQDNNGGIVIGSKTYGKGVTQSVNKFRDGSAVKMTVTEYFRPSGETVNGTGITPDIEASDGEAMDKALEELKK